MSTGKSPSFSDEAHLLREEFIDLLNHVFLAVVRVDPSRDECQIFTGELQRHHGKKFSYTALLRAFRRFLHRKDHARILHDLSLETLESYREHQADSIDFGYVTFGEERWLSVKVIADRDAPCIYLLIKRATAYQCLQKDISQMYVYDRYDYFIYLDTQANSYIMFGGSDNKTLPPVICDDYESAIVSYAETFVPPEDREMVIREMHLDRVCEMLELHGIHTLYTGVIDPERGYRRKKLEYRYYNKESKKVLLWRTDITDIWWAEQRRNAELHTALNRARTDAMTGLLNRQAACADIAAALQDMTLSALLFIDIDNFKSINDSFGHDVGDTVIIRIANILKAGIRQGQDIAGRIGGDEFIIFLRNLRSKEDALLCARRLCDRIFALNTGHHYTISSSIGIAFAPDDGTDYATLARAADQRVYRVKSSGKNGVNYTWNPDA